jgi:hypothetical protein
VLLREHPVPSFVPASLADRHATVQPEEIFESWGTLKSWLKRKIQ